MAHPTRPCIGLNTDYVSASKVNSPFIRLSAGYWTPSSGRLPWWTKAEVKLLGRVPDEEVARRTRRTVDAVRQKRQALARRWIRAHTC